MERVTWWVRRHRFDGNPLRRRTDRAESAGLLVAALLMLLCLWPAVAAGREAADGTGTGGPTPATATLLADAPVMDLSSGVVGMAEAAPARWTTPSGEQRTGPVPAPALAKAGTRVPIWLDASGRPTSPPPSAGELATTAAVAGVLVWAAGAALVAAAIAVLRRLLDRARDRAWDAAWARQGRARRPLG
ncbi:putative membrane protein [Nonomuraea coxensis DSM 45129]|uniref:Membrane protein n=1 Tax=Nonomuraea coxensis DSM 45129 TaxID=1122611 RepID=A0ABX8U410_9ACTN|nr:hypothetical protein [Nonomuraea coxensis]QYC42486.1 putative membrane protein [Nonomuraea coxensis DSM 45129]